MARKKVDPRSFLNEAEKILRKAVEGNENLTVWRGRFLHEIKYGSYERAFERDTILIGMPDDKNPSNPPAIPVAKIYMETPGAVNVHFSVGSSDDFSCFTPFEGHNPVDHIKEIVDRLPRIF